MTELRFYHLTAKTLEQVLPDLLEKSLARGWRAVVRTGSGERAETLAQHLWTFRPDSFLPHGTAKDGHAEAQPVWITSGEDNPNGATVLFLTDGAEAGDLSPYTLACDLFDGNDADAVIAARTRWKTAKAAGHDLTYWQQTEMGGWQKKA